MQQFDIPEPFEWDKTLSVGSKSMDTDHAELFEVIAQCDEGRSSNPALCKMRAYFKLHFDAEEEQMYEARYRGLAQHQLEHRHFIDRLMEARLPFTDSFITEIKHWLVHHIKTSDMAFQAWQE